MKLKNASYTVLNLYEQCPRRYKIERIDGRKRPDTAPLRIGSAVHAAIAAYLHHLQETKLQTDVTWAPLAVATARADLARENRILTVDQWDEAGEIVERFIRSHMFEPAKIAEVEKREEIPLGDLTFWAVIDLLEVEDGQARVRDWKTNWNVMSKAEVDQDFQVRCYAWAVHKLYGYDEVECILDFVRHGAVRSVLIGPEEIAKTEKRITDAIQTIEAETEWAPTPGSHCSHCPWSSECQAGEAEAEDPETLAGRILVLEAQLREAQAKLRAYCDEHGPVTVGGETFGHFPPKDGGWQVTDKATFASVLESHGLSAWDWFNVSSIKLRSLRMAKKWAHVYADVEGLIEREVQTIFTHRKAEEVG